VQWAISGVSWNTGEADAMEKYLHINVVFLVDFFSRRGDYVALRDE
jgi:hypothetical protein